MKYRTLQQLKKLLTSTNTTCTVSLGGKTKLIMTRTMMPVIKIIVMMMMLVDVVVVVVVVVVVEDNHGI